MCIYSFWCNIYFIFLETDCRFCSHQGQRDRELEVVQPSPSPQNKEESLFYARGPVFARFILIASESTNSFLSVETELRNLCALIIPNTRLDLSPLLTPTRSPNTTEMFPSPPRLRITDPLRFLLPPRWRRGYLPVPVERSLFSACSRVSCLHNPRCDSKPARRRRAAVSQLSQPQGGS